MNSKDYRPEIDGLRAVAVLSVLGFHIFPDIFPGGYVGVDIFFVISGFLITQLITQSIEAKKFSLKSFYSGRIRRLLPALFVVSIVTSIFSLFILIPNDLNYFTASQASAWGYCSNLFFSILSGGYFEQRKELFPFLHTWSLSVEEQFYFIYPIALYFISKLKNKNYYLLILFVIFLVISEGHQRNSSYYFSSMCRFFELILGAMTFSILRRPIQKNILMDVLAITLIIYPIFFFTKNTDFPGLNALVPTLGAAILIIKSTNKNLVTKLFSLRPVVYIGLISYSLYLWHWPIIAFTKYLGINVNHLIGIYVLLLSFILAIITRRYVEAPFRRMKYSFKNTVIFFWFLPFSLFFVFFIISYKTNGLPQRYNSEIRELIASYTIDRDLSRVCTLQSDNTIGIDFKKISSKCIIGDKKINDIDFMLIGDSHANHFKYLIDSLAKNAKIKGVYLVMGMCNPSSINKSEQCNLFLKSANEAAKNLGVKKLIIAGLWTESQASFQDLISTIRYMNDLHINTILIKKVPIPDSDISRCALNKALNWKFSNEKCTFEKSIALKNSKISDAALDSIGNEFIVNVVDPKDYFCDKVTCYSEIENLAVYQDSNHINQAISRKYADFLIENNRNFLIKNQ